MPSDQLPDGGNKLIGNLHERVILALESGLVLRNGFFFRLLFVVRHYTPNPLFVPARGKVTLGHRFFLPCGADKQPRVCPATRKQ